MDQPNERTKLRVLIVDDHPMMRGALRLTIDNEMDMQVEGVSLVSARYRTQVGEWYQSVGAECDGSIDECLIQ